MKKFVYTLVCFISAALFFVSCATSVPVTVTKPAEVNMASMRRIAVADFTVNRERRDIDVGDIIEEALDELFGLAIGEIAIEREVAEYTTQRFIVTLVRTNYFQVIGPNEILSTFQETSASADVQDIRDELGAQALVSGDIYLMYFEDRESTVTDKITDPDAGVIGEITSLVITRKAWLGLSYYVANTENGMLVASRGFESSLQAEQKAENAELLPEPEDMYKEIVDSFMPQVARQLAPYTVRETRKLMKYRGKDQRMDQAKQYAKGGVYDRALELYLEVWDASRNTAAGYNGAIMYEVTGDIDAAVTLMKQVVNLSPEKKVIREYNRLLQVKEEQERLIEQLE